MRTFETGADFFHYASSQGLAFTLRRELADNPTGNGDGRYSEDELWELAGDLVDGERASNGPGGTYGDGPLSAADVVYVVLCELVSELEEVGK